MADPQTTPAREPRPDKVAEVERISAAIEASTAILLTEYRGLKVGELQTLRRALRATGAEYQVVKCTLAKLAAAKAGADDLVPLLEGPVALVFVNEDVAGAAKALADFAKATPTLVVKGGVLDNKALSEADTKALADLPSREVLLSQIAGLFQAPAQNVVNLVAAPLTNIANLIDALEKRNAGTEAA